MMTDKHGNRYEKVRQGGKFHLYVTTPEGVRSHVGNKSGYATSNTATRALDILRAVANAN